MSWRIHSACLSHNHRHHKAIKFDSAAGGKKQEMKSIRSKEVPAGPKHIFFFALRFMKASSVEAVLVWGQLSIAVTSMLCFPPKGTNTKKATFTKNHKNTRHIKPNSLADIVLLFSLAWHVSMSTGLLKGRGATGTSFLKKGSMCQPCYFNLCYLMEFSSSLKKLSPSNSHMVLMNWIHWLIGNQTTPHCAPRPILGMRHVIDQFSENKTSEICTKQESGCLVTKWRYANTGAAEALMVWTSGLSTSSEGKFDQNYSPCEFRVW